MIQDRPSVRRQIIYLLSVLGAGLLAAAALVGYLLYTYGPTGQYKAENVLLDPAIVRNLTFSDTDYGKGKSGLLQLEAIRFQYFDENTQQWKVQKLTDQQYDEVYALLKRDESVQFPSEEMIKQYSSGRPSVLEFTVKQQLAGNIPTDAKVFISADFIPDTDNYRVHLRAAEGWQQYAYFVHPGVYSKVMDIIRKDGR